MDEGLVDSRVEDLGGLGVGVLAIVGFGAEIGTVLSGRREVWMKTGILEGRASE